MGRFSFSSLFRFFNREKKVLTIFSKNSGSLHLGEDKRSEKVINLYKKVMIDYQPVYDP